jgi:large subunit ribosomal protein L21
MFVIVQIGSSQYKIKEGDTINVARIDEKEDKDISIEKVLMLVNGNDIRIGQPYLTDVKIKAKVLSHPRGPKTLAFKFRRRKHSQSLKGHRQNLTSLSITKIFA